MEIGKGLWACLLDNAVVLVLVPVEAKLTDPLKVVSIGTAHLAKLLDHIPSMHLNGDEGHNLQQETRLRRRAIATLSVLNCHAAQ